MRQSGGVPEGHVPARCTGKLPFQGLQPPRRRARATWGLWASRRFDCLSPALHGPRRAGLVLIQTLATPSPARALGTQGPPCGGAGARLRGRQPHPVEAALGRGTAKWGREGEWGSGGGQTAQAPHPREAPTPLLGSSKRWFRAAPALGGDAPLWTSLYGIFVNSEKDRSISALGPGLDEQSLGLGLIPCQLPSPSVFGQDPNCFRGCGGPVLADRGGRCSGPTGPSCHLPFIQLTPAWSGTHQTPCTHGICPRLGHPCSRQGRDRPLLPSEAQRREDTAQGHTAGHWQICVSWIPGSPKTSTPSSLVLLLGSLGGSAPHTYHLCTCPLQLNRH